MLIAWAHSSAWIEWLPAEQLVEGSSPSGPVVISLLQVLFNPTGCGGIIEWNFISSVDNLRGVIDILR
jgi:hypothetical protein